MFRAARRQSAALLGALFLAGPVLIGLPACAADTGIRGTVLWGPVKPGPEKFGEDDEAPLSASFSVFRGNEKVAVFDSGRDGHFEIALPPGDYTIVPYANTPVPFPEKQVTKITVTESGYAELAIRLDTGMR